jgi:hypothetical protein
MILGHGRWKKWEESEHAANYRIAGATAPVSTVWPS